MKSDLDDPHLWIMKMEQLNREVEKCENGTRHSDEQMEATILARQPSKRRNEFVIALLHGRKIAWDERFHPQGGTSFLRSWAITRCLSNHSKIAKVAKITTDKREQGKHLALNTSSGKGDWRAFKGKCNTCGKQGHCAQDCTTIINNKNSGDQENAKLRVKCYNCGAFGHIAKECSKKVESDMFVDMTIHGAESREDDVMKNVNSAQDNYIDTFKFARELLQGIADKNNMKRAILKGIQDFKRKTRDSKQAQVKIRREKIRREQKESKIMSI
jgi:hypothetical protein